MSSCTYDTSIFWYQLAKLMIRFNCLLIRPLIDWSKLMSYANATF